MSQSCKTSYKTTNWKHYNAALKARGSLNVWLDMRMRWFAAASGKRGRSPKFSDAAIQFCLTLKNLFGLALRQTTGLVESILHLCGLAWPVPDFSTLCRRQLDLNVHVPYSRSQAGLHLKGGENWVPKPNPGKGGSGYGWQDANGDVWCPTGQGGTAHGGPHWDVQTHSGGYRNVRPKRK